MTGEREGDRDARAGRADNSVDLSAAVKRTDRFETISSDTEAWVSELDEPIGSHHDDVSDALE